MGEGGWEEGGGGREEGERRRSFLSLFDFYI